MVQVHIEHMDGSKEAITVDEQQHYGITGIGYHFFDKDDVEYYFHPASVKSIKIGEEDDKDD